ncbi:MAG: hypothetical protein BWK73_35300 [Thiothrix lacustris]|uniref:Uncharacterized protein n=1 Tax=Thiothrix lacustris TaxID=525917 RepID=A0A1Y1QG28_9GAMM|nr:MAG: hypothetical protein BWK73_35300 [Thiothrix lacustris]
MKTIQTLAMALSLTLSIQACTALPQKTDMFPQKTEQQPEKIQLADARPLTDAVTTEGLEKPSSELVVEVLRDVFVPILTALIARG